MERGNAVSTRMSCRLSPGTPFSLRVTEEVNIPARCAERCELLVDMRENADASSLDMALPLPMAEIKAWVKCALYSDFARDAEDGVPVDLNFDVDVDTLLKGLKVRILLSSFCIGFECGIQTCCMCDKSSVPLAWLVWSRTRDRRTHISLSGLHKAR